MNSIQNKPTITGNLPEPSIFDKAPLTIDEQISLFVKRGLQINNIETAKQYLTRTSYYRLSGYARLFYKDKDHNFIDGVSFKTITELYNFDRDLKFRLLEALEVLEISFKTLMINTLSVKYGSHWVLDKSHYATDATFSKTMERITELVEKNKDNVFIKHYHSEYDQPPFPPSWMIFQVFPFGDTGNIFKSLSQKNKKDIAKSYGLHQSNLESRIDCMAYLRNLCAHSDRVRNRTMTKKVNIKGMESLFPTHTSKDMKIQKHDIDSLFAYLVVLTYFVKKIRPESTRLQQFIKFINQHNQIDKERMSFPTDWEKRLSDI